MSYTLNKNNAPLFDSDFTIIEEVVDGQKLFRLQDWYQLYNGSTVPISYMNSYDDFGITRDKAIKIGGNNVGSVQSDNRAFFVSSKYFKYDVSKTYTISARVKSNNTDLVKFGFIGLTSRPTLNKDGSAVDYFNEIFNLHKYSFAHDAKVGNSEATPINSIEHYAPINKLGSTDFNTYIGYIKGDTASSLTYSTTLGLTIDNPILMRSECEYFVPFFYVHNKSFSIDTKYTILDYFMVEDTMKLDYTTEIVVSEETELNVNYYEVDNSTFYVTTGYVTAGYV